MGVQRLGSQQSRGSECRRGSGKCEGPARSRQRDRRCRGCVLSRVFHRARERPRTRGCYTARLARGPVMQQVTRTSGSAGLARPSRGAGHCPVDRDSNRWVHVVGAGLVRDQHETLAISRHVIACVHCRTRIEDRSIEQLVRSAGAERPCRRRRTPSTRGCFGKLELKRGAGPRNKSCGYERRRLLTV